MTVDFPWAIDGRGRRARPDGHVRDLIEQVLFTAPGGRRGPTSSGLLVMALSAVEVLRPRNLVQGLLERELSDVIVLEAVEVDAVDSALVVTVSYVVRHTQAHEVATFRAPGGGV
jgi:hypothetical protein